MASDIFDRDTWLEVPLIFLDGALRMMKGQPFPLVEGSQVLLKLSPWQIKDPGVREVLLKEKPRQFLPLGETVHMAVSRSMMAGNHPAAEEIQAPGAQLPQDHLFVAVDLDEDLQVLWRGDGKARLMPCQCSIPALDLHADSLNHAFTLISERIEVKRRSHTGNVFRRGFVYLEETWRSLRDLWEALLRLPER